MNQFLLKLISLTRKPNFLNSFLSLLGSKHGFEYKNYYQKDKNLVTSSKVSHPFIGIAPNFNFA